MADNYVALRLKATDDAKPDLADLKLRLDELKGKVATARADVDDVHADAKLAALEAKLASLDKRVASPRIDMAGGARAVAEMLAVEAAMKRMADEAAKSAAETDVSLVAVQEEMKKTGRAAEFMAARVRVAGINSAKGIGLFTGAASLLAMSGPFAAAGLAVGAFGAVAIPVLHKVAAAHTALTAAQAQYNKVAANEQIQLAAATSAKQRTAIEVSASKQRQMALNAEKQATAGLTGQQKGLMGQVSQLGKAWSGIEAALTPIVVDVAKVAVSLAQDLMPAFKILADVGGNALETILGYLGQFVRTPFFAQMIAQMGQLASQVAPLLGQALVGVLKVLLQLFTEAGPAGIQILSILLPLIVQLAGDLVPVITVVAKVVAVVLEWLQHTHLLIPLLAVLAVVILSIEAPITAIIIAIALLVAAGVELAKHWHQIWHAIAHDFDVARHFIAHVFDDIVHYAEIPLNWVKAHWPLILAILTGPVGLAVYAIHGHFSQIVHGAQALVGDVTGWFRSLPGRILHALGDMGHLLWNAGVSILKGLLGGLLQQWNDVTNFIGGIGSWISNHKGPISADAVLLQPHGIAIMRGLVSGLRVGMGTTMSYVSGMARALSEQVTAALNAGVITQSQASSLLGSISNKLAADASKVAKAAEKISLAFNRQLMTGLEDPATASAAKSAVGKLASLVKQAWTSGLIGNDREASISTWLAGQSAKLQALAGQRANIEKTIAAAKQFAATTASNVAGNYTISGFATSGPNGGVAPVSAIISGLRLDVSHIRKFAANLKKLAKEGLNRNYLNQLIQMGPEQGGDLAAELASAGLGDIKAINAAEAAITKTSGALGKQAANEMYDTGKNAGEGFLSGLRGTLKSLNEMIRQMAKAMVATLKKELGISSPSTVLRWHGQMAGEGFRLGIEDQVQRVSASSQRLARAAVPGRGGYGAQGAGGGGRYELVLTVEKSGDPLIDAVLHGLRVKVRTLGGDPDMFAKKVAFR